VIGKKVSHYQVLEKIGEGGMGEVYIAQDERLHRHVALKFLPEHLTRDPTRKQRFLQEARAAAAIEHPHIGAIEVYRKLNTADPSSKWVAMYEPRFVLEIARLLDQQGDEESARQEYQRFVELWSDADPGLPELEEARAFLARQ
jgi:serine/threonine protein kinase